MRMRSVLAIVVMCSLFSSCMGGMDPKMMLFPVAGQVALPLAAGYTASSITGPENDTGKDSPRGNPASNRHQRPVAEFKSGDLSVQIQAVVQPDDQNSLSKSATWTEILFTAKNLSERDLVVERIQVVDGAGVFRDQTMPDEPMRLAMQEMQASNRTAAEILSPANQVISSLAGTAASMLFPGAGLLVGGMRLGQVAGHVREETRARQDGQAMIHEFQKRQVTRFALAPGGLVSGSAFFPQGDAQEIRFSYTANGEPQEVAVRIGGGNQKIGIPDIPSSARAARVRTANGYAQVLK